MSHVAKTLEERKFEQETADKKRELDIKEREVTAKELEQKRLRWSSPIIITILAAVAGITGSLVTMINNKANLELERQKEQSVIIIEAIKTDQTQACQNLRFLVAAGVLEDKQQEIMKVCSNPVPPSSPTGK